MADVKAEVTKVELKLSRDIANLKADLIKWMIAILITILVGMLGGMFFKR